jgi:predicted type IV restriction endonuclease
MQNRGGKMPADKVIKAPRRRARRVPKKIAFGMRTITRIKAALPKIKRTAKLYADRKEAEADTRLLVVDILEAMGWDQGTDLTGETRVRGDAMDFALSLKGDAVAAIEVKSSSVKLAERHLRQVEKYSADSGFEWMILTNGREWQLYHLTFNRPLLVDLIATVDLFDDVRPAALAEALAIFSKEAFVKNFVGTKWETRIATSPEQLRSVLFSKEVVNAFRKQLRKKSGQLLPLDETVRILREWLKV